MKKAARAGQEPWRPRCASHRGPGQEVLGGATRLNLSDQKAVARPWPKKFRRFPRGQKLAARCVLAIGCDILARSGPQAARERGDARRLTADSRPDCANLSRGSVRSSKQYTSVPLDLRFVGTGPVGLCSRSDHLGRGSDPLADLRRFSAGRHVPSNLVDSSVPSPRPVDGTSLVPPFRSHTTPVSAFVQDSSSR